MSHKAEAVVSTAYTLYQALLDIPWVNRGLPCTHRDVTTLAESYTLFACLLVDLDLLSLRDASKYVKRLAQLDVSVVAQRFKDFDKLIVKFYTTSEVISLSSFKHCLAENWILRPYHRLLCRMISMPSEGLHFRCLHQIAVFLNRVCLLDVDEADDIQAFLDRNAAEFQIDIQLATRLQPILEEWLKDIIVNPWGHHGPGSTADAGRIDAVLKDTYLNYDSLHAYAFRRSGFAIEDFLPKSSSLHGPTNRYVKLITVPKTALKRRTIALETVESQYFQQAFRDSLYSHIDRHLRMIPLYHQEINRRMAYQGSISGKVSTIDLSAASDSVRWDLVRIAFRKCERVLPWLYASRSRYVQYADKTFPLKIFATMGNAICFPIESLIFAAICECAYRDSGRRPNSRGISAGYTVYGDDITCLTCESDRILDYLTRLGFTPNLDKTCANDAPFVYRESCGAEYLAGVDVSPLKLPRRFRRLDPRRAPETVSSYIALANACLEYGFLSIRQVLIRELLDARMPPPLFGEGESQLHPLYPATNYRCRKRWNADLQRREALALASVVFHNCRNCRMRDKAVGNDLRRCAYCTHHPLAQDADIDEFRYHLWWTMRMRNPECISHDRDYVSADGAAIRIVRKWQHPLA